MARSNTNLSKSTLIRSIQCQKSLYLYKNFYHLRDPISKIQQKRFDRGHDIGRLAQELFPQGKNVAPKSPRYYHQSIKATAYLIQQNYPAIYEAAFRQQGVLIFLDILIFRAGSWFGYEVKSARKISETHLQDAAIQYHIITESGLHLEDFSIIYIDDTYNEEEEASIDIHKLFLEKSVKKEIIDLQPYVKRVISNARQTLMQENIPVIEMGNHCETPYRCDFKGYCSK